MSVTRIICDGCGFVQVYCKCARSSGVARLQKHFDRLKRDGLFDMKFAIADDMSGATVESVSSELADIFDAIQRGDCVPLKLNDSRRIPCMFDGAAPDMVFGTATGLACPCPKCSPQC